MIGRFPILYIAEADAEDAILSSGVLAHLVDSLPQAVFTIVGSAASAPLFADTGRFDCRIEPEQIGLAGNIFDERYDFIHLTSSISDVFAESGKFFGCRGYFGCTGRKLLHTGIELLRRGGQFIADVHHIILFFHRLGYGDASHHFIAIFEWSGASDICDSMC